MDLGAGGIQQGNSGIGLAGSPGGHLIQFGVDVVGAPVLELDGLYKLISSFQTGVIQSFTEVDEMLGTIHDFVTTTDNLHRKQVDEAVDDLRSNLNTQMKLLREDVVVRLDSLAKTEMVAIADLYTIFREQLTASENRILDHIHHERWWLRFKRWFWSLRGV